MYNTKPRISEACLMTAGEGALTEMRSSTSAWPQGKGQRSWAERYDTTDSWKLSLDFCFVHMLLGLEKKAFTPWGFLLKRFSDVIMTPTT